MATILIEFFTKCHATGLPISVDRKCAVNSTTFRGQGYPTVSEVFALDFNSQLGIRNSELGTGAF